MIKFELKKKPVSNNKFYAGIHWAKRKKIVDDWHEEIWLLCRQKGYKPITKYPIITEFEFHFKGKRALDIDNCGATCKLIMDGLRYAKVIEDDTIDHWNVLNTKTFNKTGEDKIIVTIK